MRALVRYTAARLGLFAIAFGLIWAVGWGWLVWDAQTVLSTALVALVVSAIASWLLLRRLRADLSAHVEGRARRLASAFEQSRRAEDGP